MIERVTSGVRRFASTERLERHLRALFAASTAVASAGLAACAGPMDGGPSGLATSGPNLANPPQPHAQDGATASMARLALGLPVEAATAAPKTTQRVEASLAAERAEQSVQAALIPAAMPVPAPANESGLALPAGEELAGAVVQVDAATAAKGPAAILLRHDFALAGQDFDRNTAYIRRNLDSLRRVLEDGKVVRPRSDSDYHAGRYIFVRPAQADQPPKAVERPQTVVAQAAPSVLPPKRPETQVAAASPQATRPAAPLPLALMPTATTHTAAPEPDDTPIIQVPEPKTSVTVTQAAPSNDNRADTPPALVGGPATPHLLVNNRDASMGPQHIAKLIARTYERDTGQAMQTVDWRLLINAERGLTYSEQSANRAVRPGLHLLARNRDEFNWLRRVYQDRSIAQADPERRRLSLALEREYSPRLSAELERKAMLLASDATVWDATYTFVATQYGRAGEIAQHLEDHALMLPDSRMRVISRLAVQLRAETEARPVARRLRETAFPREIQNEIAGIGAGVGLQITPADYQIALQDIETRLVSYADLLKGNPAQAVDRLISNKGAVGPNQIINEWMRDRRNEGLAVRYVENIDVLRDKVADVVRRAQQLRSNGMEERRAGRWLEDQLKALDDRFDRERMSVITSRQFIQTVRAFAEMGLSPEAQMHFAIEAYLRGQSNAQKLARDYVTEAVPAGMTPEEFLQNRRLRDAYGAKKIAHLRIMDAERRAGVQVAEAAPLDNGPTTRPVQVAMAAPAAEISALAQQQREAEAFRRQQGGTERPTLTFANRNVTSAARAIVSNYARVAPTAERRSMAEMEQAARVMWAERENDRQQSVARREQLRTLLEMVVDKLENMAPAERAKYMAQVQELHELSLKTINDASKPAAKPIVHRAPLIKPPQADARG